MPRVIPYSRGAHILRGKTISCNNAGALYMQSNSHPLRLDLFGSFRLEKGRSIVTCVRFNSLYSQGVNPFYLDILAQPQALHDLAAFYRTHDTLLHFPVPVSSSPTLTGMGASFHAAWIAALHLHRDGIPALALEATDLLQSPLLLTENSQLVYISQSGASAEVAPILARLKEDSTLVAVTNNTSSPLAQRARVVLPLVAGEEKFVATKTYVNSLAALWLLVRTLSGGFARGDVDTLQRIAERCETLLQDADTISARWLATFQHTSRIFFIGAGPHAATARQAAMMAAEWAKVPALSFSAGAFRHGFIESVEQFVGVVLFAPRGATYATILSLAQEISEYGARVLLVSNGRTFALGEQSPVHESTDEFLSPILDILPAQLFAEALARALAIPPGFRYIGKVINKL